MLAQVENSNICDGTKISAGVQIIPAHGNFDSTNLFVIAVTKGLDLDDKETH